MPTARDFLYGEKSPWPAAAERDPERMPPAVPNPPGDEIRDFFDTVVERYNQNVTHDWPRAARHCLLHPHLPEVSDRELVWRLSDTAFSYAVNPTLDRRDEESFAEFMNVKARRPLALPRSTPSITRFVMPKRNVNAAKLRLYPSRKSIVLRSKPAKSFV